MATPGDDDYYTPGSGKRYTAKYLCEACGESWKVKNTASLKKICKNEDCRVIVKAYKCEVINTLVTYKCVGCSNVLKLKKCSSEVNDVPFCKICHKDMVVIKTELLWEPKRKFGEFFCSDCRRGWKSGNAWEGKGQQCLVCKKMVLPHNLRPLQFRGIFSKGNQPHQQEHCEMCKELGRSCEGYTPVVNVANPDDIPIEEDDEQSIITVNSSVFGEVTSTSSDSDLTDTEEPDIEETASQMAKMFISDVKQTYKHD